MKKIFLSFFFLCSLIVLATISLSAKKTAIVAHRGFWNTPESGYAENSISSITNACKYGFWGCETDLQLTKDGRVLVHHDPNVGSKLISEHNLSEFGTDTLKNGERVPALEEYLSRFAAVGEGTVLVLELKPQKSAESENILVERTLSALKQASLLDAEKVAFISFSRHICSVVAAKAPDFSNQYLGGDLEPALAKSELGCNGVDYHFSVFQKHPDWVKRAHKLGMKVNAWTVNSESDLREMADLKVDQLTTNEPLTARRLLGRAERRAF